MIQITREDLEYTFDSLNQIIFNGRVEIPEMEILHETVLDTHWALTVGVNKYSLILFRRAYDNHELFVETMAHEMIHVMQISERGGSKQDDMHDGFFWSWKHHLNTFGIPLRVYG